MRESLKDVTLRSYEAYLGHDRVEWILSWPGQVVLCSSQMYWTMEVADSIQKGTLQSYQQKLNQQLQCIVNKVILIKNCHFLGVVLYIFSLPAKLCW